MPTNFSLNFVASKFYSEKPCIACVKIDGAIKHEYKGSANLTPPKFNVTSSRLQNYSQICEIRHF